MHGEELVVRFLRQYALKRQSKLHAHDERQNASQLEEEEGGADIISASLIVVYDRSQHPARRSVPDSPRHLNPAFARGLPGREPLTSSGRSASGEREGKSV